MPPLLNPSEDPKTKVRDVREERAWKERLDRVAAEKKAALLDPGPTWTEWFYYDVMRWWLAIVFLILDSWVVVQWLTWGSVVGLVVSLALAVYAEFLVYRVLWTRPDPAPVRRRAKFRRTWYRPVLYGRWTPEGTFARTHPAEAMPVDEGPRADEFL